MMPAQTVVILSRFSRASRDALASAAPDAGTRARVRPTGLRWAGVAVLAGLGALSVAPKASALDLPVVAGHPIKVDVTETSIVSQRFNAREGEDFRTQGYFAWLNRLNLVLNWDKITVGARIDSALYGLRPEDREILPKDRQITLIDGASRYRDSIYPAKLYASYKIPGLELSAGDSYAQLGRGLVLSLRKVDELGIDTTAFGGKVVLQKDPASFTMVAGFLNPSRVDEPTGRALFLPKALENEARQPLFGSDRVVAGQIQLGRGLPVVLSTNVAHFTKCSPFRYDERGNVVDGAFDKPFGSCETRDVSEWLASLPKNLSPTLAAASILNASQTLEIPSLFDTGSLYVEAAIQKREGETGREAGLNGNALYAALTTNKGPLTNTLEVKSYRNYFNVAGSVNVTKASAFANLAYSAVPTIEPIISDTMFGFYNACVNGARDRVDARLSPNLLLYGAFGYSVTKSELPGGACDGFGKSPSAEDTTNFVTDLLTGIEMRFDQNRSFFFANTNMRNDVRSNGEPYYKERAVQYTLTKYVTGPYSIEFAGRHRVRYQENENQIEVNDAAGNTVFSERKWVQGENYTALKVAPQWVVTHGFEYTTQDGFPTIYNNGSILWRFTMQNNLRLFVGQQRGGLRCVSGICRLFPAFSGARIELTLRF